MWINSNQNKGAKTKTKKTPKAHIFDEEVWDIAGLFGSQEDDFEEPTNTNNSQNNESQKEVTKSDPNVEVDSKSIEHNESIKAIGFSTIINKSYLNYECQAYISWVYEHENKFKVWCRAVHLNIQPEHLQFCDFTKYANSKVVNKKKNQDSVVNEIISSYRSNILHRIPFFQTIETRENNQALVVAEECTADLTDKFVKIFWMTETRQEWEDSKALYILGVNKDNKVAIQNLELVQKETTSSL